VSYLASFEMSCLRDFLVILKEGKQIPGFKPIVEEEQNVVNELNELLKKSKDIIERSGALAIVAKTPSNILRQ